MRIFNAVVDLVLSNRANALRRDVLNHGGRCEHEFSQCQQPISTWLASSASLHPSVNGGICSALSSHWIYYHACGSSLWNWLYPNGGMVPHAGRLNQIMRVQAEGLAFVGEQEKFEDRWLLNHSIHRRMNWSVGFNRQLGATEYSMERPFQRRVRLGRPPFAHQPRLPMQS